MRSVNARGKSGSQACTQVSLQWDDGGDEDHSMNRVVAIVQQDTEA